MFTVWWCVLFIHRCFKVLLAGVLWKSPESRNCLARRGPANPSQGFALKTLLPSVGAAGFPFSGMPVMRPGKWSTHGDAGKVVIKLTALLHGLRPCMRKEMMLAYCMKLTELLGGKAKRKWLLDCLIKWCLIDIAIKAFMVGWAWLHLPGELGSACWQGSGSQ